MAEEILRNDVTDLSETENITYGDATEEKCSDGSGGVGKYAAAGGLAAGVILTLLAKPIARKVKKAWKNRKNKKKANGVIKTKNAVDEDGNEMETVIVENDG